MYRLNGIFGSDDVTSTPSGAANEIVPFNPKHVLLEVFGPPGTVATITYLDVNAQPQRADDVDLPWAYDMTTTQPAVFVNVSAQGDSNSIGCRIKSTTRSRTRDRSIRNAPTPTAWTSPDEHKPDSGFPATVLGADRAVLAGPRGGHQCLRAAAGDRRRSAQRVAEPAGCAVAAGHQTYRQGVSTSSTPTARR